MTSDAHQRLCSLKDELANLEPWPWNNIAAWSAKATPIIRSDWPDHFDDFSKAIARPHFTRPINVLLGDQHEGTDDPKQDSANKLRAKQAKERILSFLEGLVAATGHPAPPALIAFDKNDPIAVRQQILQALLEIQGDSPNTTDGNRIAERLGLGVGEVEGHLGILRDDGKVQFTRMSGAYLKAAQKQRFLESLRSPHNEPSERAAVTVPVEVTESLKQFRRDHPDASKVAFIMMRFGSTAAHNSIVEGIRSTLQPHGIKALRADDKEFHSDLWYNVLTYIIGCGFGIAVFERLEQDEFNPNASLEVGCMYGLKKPVCLLKDKTLKTLQTDLVGKLYRPFDPQDPKTTIPTELSKWLKDKRLVK